MTLEDMRDLGAALTRIANLPMVDAAHRLHALRLTIEAKTQAMQKEANALLKQ